LPPSSRVEAAAKIVVRLHKKALRELEKY